MKQENFSVFKKGLKDGFPICLGYFAVAFTLGIAAKNAGLTPFQAFISSLLTNASAGEAAAFSLIAKGGTYMEMALMMLICNARYILMSCALSQKLSPKTSLLSRLIIGYDVTDEIFALSVSVNGYLNPFYSYGLILIAVPGWAFGTYLGVIMGNVLPAFLVSALSVALYGMFIFIIIPPAREDKKILALVIISMLLSYISLNLPILKSISEGTMIIILTVLISSLAAIIFPRKEEAENE